MTDGDFVNLKVSGTAKVAGDTTTKTLAVGDPGPAPGTVQIVSYIGEKPANPTGGGKEIVLTDSSIQAKCGVWVSKSLPLGPDLKKRVSYTWSGLNFNLTPLSLQPLGGTVGIGTTNPEGLLHLSSDDGKCLVLQSPKGGADNTVSLDFQTYKQDNSPIAPTASIQAIDDGKYSSHLTFKTKQPGNDQNELTEHLRITDQGNVGIGTAKPERKLSVGVQDVGASGFCDGLTVVAADGHEITLLPESTTRGCANPLVQDGDGSLIFTNGTLGSGSLTIGQWSTSPRGIRIDINGNVGIGTATPTGKLEVNGDAVVMGNMTLAGGNQINCPGRMHITGEEILYLLHKQGVIIGKEFGGTGNLSVEGNVNIGGDLTSNNADCAEDFDVVNSELVEAGTVMVINEDGALAPSYKAYDKCVAGVISGAGKYKSGIVLDKQPSRANRLPIALIGKVYCKVDASCESIEVGDLLTTSSTVGYAMKASDSGKAFGAIIGKALKPLNGGRDLIPILVALQ